MATNRVDGSDFNLAQQSHRTLTHCNLCGAPLGPLRLKGRERFGYQVSCSVCPRCGLICLNPQMTAEGYAVFYRDVYRQLLTARVGRPVTAETIELEQQSYAANVASVLQPFLSDLTGGRLLDIGGSTGVVAEAVCQAGNLQGAVVEPCAAEADRARAKGLAVYQAGVEQASMPMASFDVILLCRSVEHLLDIAETFRRIHDWLTPGGICFVDAVVYRKLKLKLDHPYLLKPRHLLAYLLLAGLEPRRVVASAGGERVGFVCRRDK